MHFRKFFAPEIRNISRLPVVKSERFKVKTSEIWNCEWEQNLPELLRGDLSLRGIYAKQLLNLCATECIVSCISLTALFGVCNNIIFNSFPNTFGGGGTRRNGGARREYKTAEARREPIRLPNFVLGWNGDDRHALETGHKSNANSNSKERGTNTNLVRTLGEITVTCEWRVMGASGARRGWVWLWVWLADWLATK